MKVQRAEVVGRVDRVVAAGVGLLPAVHGGGAEGTVLREEPLLLFTDHVGANREPVREGRGGLVGRSAAPRPPVRIARRRDLLDVSDRNPGFAVRPQLGGLARVTILRVTGERRPVVAGLERVDVVAPECGADVEGQLVARLPVDVEADIALALVVGLDAPHFLGVTAGDEVPCLARAALHLGIVRLERSVLDQRLVHVERLRPIRALELRVELRLVIRALPIDAGAQTERPLRSILCPPALREDLDYAVGRLRAVEGRRRSTLQHLDAIDVVGIQVRQAILARAAVEVAACLVAETRRPVGGASVGAHAVDVHDRALTEREARGAANAEVLGTAHPAAHSRGAKTGHLSFQDRPKIRGRLDLGDLAGVNDADRRSKLALRHRSTRAGRHDLVEGDNAPLKHDGHLHRIARGHRERFEDGPVADALRADGSRSATHTANDEVAAAIGLRAEPGAGDDDEGAAQRLPVCAVRHGTDDEAGLLRPEDGRRDEERQRESPAHEVEAAGRRRVRGTGCHGIPR